MIKRALISVSNKEGIIEFAKGLSELDVEIISTGGTAKALKDAGIKVTAVSDITEFPEILDGRVKTLHPKIHGGILGRRIDVADPAPAAVAQRQPLEQEADQPGEVFDALAQPRAAQIAGDAPVAFLCLAQAAAGHAVFHRLGQARAPGAA